MPTLRVHKDPSIYFGDKSARHETGVDGRFCGMKKIATKEELMEEFKLKGNESYLHEEDNELYYYFYRDHRSCDFILLTTGEYKRSDLLSMDDKQQIQTVEGSQYIFDSLSEEERLNQKRPSPLVIKQDVECIYSQFFCNDKEMFPAKLFPTKTLLPLARHSGFTTWDANTGNDATYPLIYNLKDPQRLHNFVMSQMATIIKNSSSDKWLFSQDHLLTPTQIEQAKEINTIEGGMDFGGDISTIRREKPAELPMSMIQMAQTAKQELDEIAGAMIDRQDSEQAVISGKAMKEITHNLSLMQVGFIAKHIRFVSTIADIQREMIPNIVTEERTLIVKKSDGSNEAITVNQDLGTGEIRNNIKDINNNFYYKIDAGPSSTMQKENTLKALQTIYQLDPSGQTLNDTKDIYMRNLESPDAGELERRVAAKVDPALIKYSRGEISQEQFMQETQKAQQAQVQQQAEIQKMNPEVQAQMAAVKAEEGKGAAMAKEADTNRMEAMAKIQTDRMKIAQDAQKNMNEMKVKLAQLQQQREEAQGAQAIELIQKELDHQQQLIDEAQTKAQMRQDKENAMAQAEGGDDEASSAEAN